MHHHHQGMEAAKKDGRVQRMDATSAPAKKNGARKDRTSVLAGLPVWPNIDRCFLGPCSVQVPPESVGSLRLITHGVDSSHGQLPAVIALDRSPLIVGRNGRSGAEILLDDDHQKLISELHAVFRFVVSETETFWEFFDLGSLNGTVVNGRKTDHSRLTHGARIVFGAGGALKIGDLWMESSSSSRLSYFFHKGPLPVLTCKHQRTAENKRHAPNTHVDGAPLQKRMRISEQDIPLAQAASSCATSELPDNTSAEDHALAHISTASAGRSGLKLAGGISQIPPAREKSHSLQHVHSATVMQAQPNAVVGSKMPLGKEQAAPRGEFKDLSWDECVTYADVC